MPRYIKNALFDVFTKGERKSTEEWMKIIKRYRRDLRKKENLSDEIFPSELKPRPNSRKNKNPNSFNKKTKIRKSLKNNSKNKIKSKRTYNKNKKSKNSPFDLLLKLLGLE